MNERKNYVVIYYDISAINVDGDLLAIPDVSPSTILDKFPESVDPNSVTNIAWQNGVITFYRKVGQSYKAGEDKYDDYIQPYVDIWQAEKNRIEQEQQEQQEEWNKFENRQARALTQLNKDFETVSLRAYVKSSLGFTANADRIAKENVQGLIEEVGEGTVQFCDYYNQFHELNKSQLETLKSEINQNGQALYAQKWQYRTAIENCVDNEGLDAVVATIEFTYMDFNTLS